MKCSHWPTLTLTPTPTKSVCSPILLCWCQCQPVWTALHIIIECILYRCPCQCRPVRTLHKCSLNRCYTHSWRHNYEVWTVTLVTMQPTFYDLKSSCRGLVKSTLLSPVQTVTNWKFMIISVSYQIPVRCLRGSRAGDEGSLSDTSANLQLRHIPGISTLQSSLWAVTSLLRPKYFLHQISIKERFHCALASVDDIIS